MNQVYDFKRIVLLARLKFNLHKKVLMMSVLGYFGLLLIIGFFIAYAGRNNTEEFSFYETFHYISISIMMLLGCVLLASRSFQDMNTPERSIGQILIPASTFEKFILPMISTSIIWLVFSFVSYHLFSLIFNCAWSCSFGYDFQIFYASEIFKIPFLFEITLAIILVHSTFLLGAATFKRYPIVKTLISLTVLQWSFSLLALIVIVILFGSMENFGEAMESLGNLLADKDWFVDRIIYKGEVIETMGYRIRYFWRLMMFLVSTAFYVTAYFKLKEREV